MKNWLPFECLPLYSHRQNAGFVVFQLEVFVSECPTKNGLTKELFFVDRFSSAAVAVRYIASLHHKIRTDPVKLGSFVPEPFLAGAEGAEVLGGFGRDVGAQFEHDSTDVDVIDGYVEKHARIPVFIHTFIVFILLDLEKKRS